MALRTCVWFFLTLFVGGLTGCCTASTHPDVRPNEEPSAQQPAPSQPRVEALADRILENTPEHTHWVKGTRSDWVLFDPAEIVAPQELQDEVLRRFKKKYKIYESFEQIPDELKRMVNGQLAGYNSGFEFTYKVRIENEKAIVAYFDWEGMRAARWQTITYEWNESDWIIIEKGPGAIS